MTVKNKHESCFMNMDREKIFSELFGSKLCEESLGENRLLSEQLRSPEKGTFAEILTGLDKGVESRKVVAASFLLRYGWSSGVAIGAYLLGKKIPDIAFDNIAIRFKGDHYLFDSFCLVGRKILPDLENPGPEERRQQLTEVLFAHATEMVEVLQIWSSMNFKTLWGLMASSWAGQILAVTKEMGDQKFGEAEVKAFFEQDLPVKLVQPPTYWVEHAGKVQCFYLRSACCLYYKREANNYCANCPLIEEEDRLQRNRNWMEKQQMMAQS